LDNLSALTFYIKYYITNTTRKVPRKKKTHYSQTQNTTHQPSRTGSTRVKPMCAELLMQCGYIAAIQAQYTKDRTNSLDNKTNESESVSE